MKKMIKKSRQYFAISKIIPTFAPVSVLRVRKRDETR